MRRTNFPQIEPLEARIAPASLVALHPLPAEIVAGIGKTGATIDLGSIYDSDGSYHSLVKFTTNFDSDLNTPGLQGNTIEIELYDHEAPLTVQNFLAYALNSNRKADYDGTFFHRSADFGATSGPGRDIIQGGGFSLPALGHIPTRPEVHNEYDPTRPNERGTLAVAKTGLNPNTATSEWFINVNDNSSILGGDNNGGYTVFGKVVAGLDLVDRIAAQQTFAGGDAFGELPVQNYTGGPVLFSNLIQITDTKVTKPANGVSDGIQFEVLSVVDNATGQPTDLLSAKLNGSDTLALKYKAGETGVAKVTVRATNGAGDVGLSEFLVTVQPNLIAESAGDTLAEVIVPGENGSVSVKLTNSAGGVAEGLVEVKYYLSQATTGDPNGTTLNPETDILIGSSTHSLNLGSGKSITLTGNVAITEEMNLVQGEIYRVLTQVNTATAPSVTELFTDDNVAQEGELHRFADAAGKSNLVVANAGDTLPFVIVPGDGGEVKVSLTNNAAVTANGLVNVKFYLSQSTTTEPNADVLDASDREIGAIFGKSINLASGKSILLSSDVQIPATLALEQGAYYRILAQVTTPEGSTVTDALAADSVMTNGSAHRLFHAFGTFTDPDGGGSRTNAVLSYVDAESQIVSMSIKGKGVGQIVTDAEGGRDLQVSATTAASQLRVQTAFGLQTTLDDVTIFAGTDTQLKPIGEIGKFTAGGLDLTGNFIANAGAKSVTLGNFEGGGNTSHTFSLGQTSKSINFRPVVMLGSVEDTRFDSSVPVASLSAAEWRDVNVTQELIAAPGLVKFSVRGDFEADMTISGTARVNAFSVDGVMKGSNVKIAGNVGAVTVGAMDTSKFLVGASAVPAALGQFDSARTIASFIVKGSGATPGMVDSSVAARTFGSISVSSVDGASGAADFGFFAGVVSRYQRGDVVNSNLSTPVEFDAIGNYALRILPQNAPQALG